MWFIEGLNVLLRPAAWLLLQIQWAIYIHLFRTCKMVKFETGCLQLNKFDNWCKETYEQI